MPDKKYLYNSLAFIIVFVVLLCLSSLSYYYIVINNTNIYKNQKQFEENNNRSLRTVFFGDSLPALAVNPQFIDNAFNYAVPSERYDQTFYKVRNVLNNNSNVGTIVLPYDVHDFSRPDEPNTRYHYVWYWADLVPINDLEKITGKSKLKILANKYLPFIGNGKDFLTVFLLNERTEMYKGWQKNLKTVELTDFSADNNIEEPQIHDDVLNYFLNTIEIAQSKNKRIILVKYPDLPAALAGKEDEKIKIFYDKLADRIKKSDNISVLDYRKFSKDHELFSDSAHLNYKGAEVFSRRLNNDLKNLLAKKDIK